MSALAVCLLRLKCWQILSLGLLALVASLLLVAGVAHLGYMLPAGYWMAVMAGHILATGAAFWFVPGPFIAAYTLRSMIPPLDVFDEEAV